MVLDALSVNAGDGDDTLFGSDIAEDFNGGGRNDTINAGGGNDTLDGGDGNDALNGGDGNDTIDSNSRRRHDRRRGGGRHDRAAVTVAAPRCRAGREPTRWRYRARRSRAFNAVNASIEIIRAAHRAAVATASLAPCCQYLRLARRDGARLAVRERRRRQRHVVGSDFAESSTAGAITTWSTRGAATTVDGGRERHAQRRDGNDTIESFSGDDTIDAGAGDDRIGLQSNGGGTTVQGGTGADTLAISNGMLGAFNANRLDRDHSGAVGGGYNITGTSVANTLDFAAPRSRRAVRHPGDGNDTLFGSGRGDT